MGIRPGREWWPFPSRPRAHCAHVHTPKAVGPGACCGAQGLSLSPSPCPPPNHLNFFRANEKAAWVQPHCKGGAIRLSSQLFLLHLQHTNTERASWQQATAAVSLDSRMQQDIRAQPSSINACWPDFDQAHNDASAVIRLPVWAKDRSAANPLTSQFANWSA